MPFGIARWQTREALSTSIFMHLIICVVPVVYMWDVLVTNQFSHLANPGIALKASSVTDLDGSVRMAYWLSGMSSPWAETTFISSPIGASFWSLQSFSQSIQTVYLWVTSCFVDPMLATNSLVLLGWILTGTSTYLIARHIRCNKFLATACAIAVQLAPCIRFMAANFTSYVFIGVPILNLLFTIQYFEKQHRHKPILPILSLGLTALFDSYWFFYSIFGIVCISLVYFSREAWTERFFRGVLKLLSVIVIYVVLSRLGVELVSTFVTSENQRKIAVASTLDVQNSVLGWGDWTDSDYVGIGYIVPVLFALAVAVAMVRRNFRVLTLILLAVGFILISTKVTIPFLGIDISMAMSVRQLMPGVRFFDRAALIAIPLIIVVIAKAMQEIFTSMFRYKAAYLFVPFAITCIPLSYPNITIPESLSSHDDWSEVRKELSREADPRVLALPFFRRGRDWIEQANFRAPLANDHVHSVMNKRIVLHASNGISAFTAYLGSIGVTHVFSIDSELSQLLDYELSAPRFLRVGTLLLSGFGEGDDYKLNVYKVKPQANDIVCKECGFGSHVRGLLDIQVTGDLVHPVEVMPDGERWWWVGAGNSIVKVQYPYLINKSNFIDINFSIVPCASSVHVVVKSEKFFQNFDLNKENFEKLLRVPTGKSINAQVVISARGTSCSVANDPRQLLLQLSD